MEKRPVLILDRDGTIIHNNQSKEGGPYYVTEPEQIEFVDGAIESLQMITCEVYPFICVITTQNCIYKGLATPQQVDKVNQTIRETLWSMGVMIEHFNVAWAVENKVESRIAQITDTIYQAAFYNIQPSSVWMVDDSVDGITAAQKVGINGVHIALPHRTSFQLVQMGHECFFEVNSFPDAIDCILREIRQRNFIKAMKGESQ